MAAIDRGPLDALVASYAAEHHCPTIAWGVVRDGALAVTGAFGDADVSAESVYRIASMTKSFSAAATLLLRDEGVLRLDDRVSMYDPTLAALRSPTIDAPAVTVRDLLSMGSGLVTDDAWADRHLDLTDDEFDAIIADGCVFGEPTGTAYEYSNFGFAVLARVVQRASGIRIQDVISSRLLSPLGMHDSTWVEPDHDRWMPPLRFEDGEFVDEGRPTPGDGLIAAMGGIWTTVADLARWVTWLDDAFPARNGADDGPLSRASRRELQTIHRYVGYRTTFGVRHPSGYGYGVRVLDHPDLGTIAMHSGGLPGYGSNMRWLPGRRLGVIALSNVTYAPMTELGARLMAALHEQGAVPNETRAVTDDVRSAGERLVALLNDWDDATADALFTDNVAWDESYARRRAEAAERGPFVIERIDATNDARAIVRCTTTTITFALAPPRPPRIQEYDIEPASRSVSDQLRA